MSTTPRPFLKFPGGKSRLVPELMKYVPPSFDTYNEPFVGGGALFWALRPKKAFLSDANAELITTYKAVRDNVDELIEHLRVLQGRFTPEHYYAIRGADWRALSQVEAAARMIYLNKCCFNGLVRYNKRGEFNAPIGRFSSPPAICDEENLRACSEVLQPVGIDAADFEKAIHEKFTDKGEFVYFDPPYLPAKFDGNGSFTSYTSSGFGIADHRNVWALACRLKKQGTHVLISSSGSEFARELYGRDGVLEIHEIDGRHNIGRTVNSRVRVAEFVIT